MTSPVELAYRDTTNAAPQAVTDANGLPVVVTGATPAGTNNIGDVDVLTQIGVANGPITQVATSTTSGVAIAARATRRSVMFKNIDTAITIYVSDDATATSANGIPLLAGESVRFNATIAYSCLAASGTPILVVEEEYD